MERERVRHGPDTIEALKYFGRISFATRRWGGGGGGLTERSDKSIYIIMAKYG